jgi:hypothetical protein
MLRGRLRVHWWVGPLRRTRAGAVVIFIFTKLNLNMWHLPHCSRIPKITASFESGDEILDEGSPGCFVLDKSSQLFLLGSTQ